MRDFVSFVQLVISGAPLGLAWRLYRVGQARLALRLRKREKRERRDHHE